jgi:hypothetical protein
LAGDKNQRITREHLTNLPKLHQLNTQAVGVAWAYFESKNKS